MDRYLILSDGSAYKGQAFGAQATTSGNIIYNTNMTGYQEVITNPIYHNQIVVFTVPTLGNIGIKYQNYESIDPVIKGVVVHSISNISTNRKQKVTLDDFLKLHNIPGIYDIDTRKLVHQLHVNKNLKASIVDYPDDHAFDQLNATVLPDSLLDSNQNTYVIPGDGPNIVVLDFGLKKGMLRELSKRHANIIVVPASFSLENILNLDPDGIILSSGPGDPNLVDKVILDKIVDLEKQIPLLGIGLGHQLFALANGASIEPLQIAHEGSNHPILEIVTKQIMYANQAENYIVQRKTVNYEDLLITHVDLIDGSIQGLRHRNYPAFSVEFSPDATPGPLESTRIFDDFIDML